MLSLMTCFMSLAITTHQIAFNPGNNVDEPKHLCEDITLTVPPIIETVLGPHQNKMVHSIALGMLFICQYELPRII